MEENEVVVTQEEEAAIKEAVENVKHIYITDVLADNLMDDFCCLWLSVNESVDTDEKGNPVVDEGELKTAQEYAKIMLSKVCEDWEAEKNAILEVVHTPTEEERQAAAVTPNNEEVETEVE